MYNHNIHYLLCYVQSVNSLIIFYNNLVVTCQMVYITSTTTMLTEFSFSLEQIHLKKKTNYIFKYKKQKGLRHAKS